MIQGIIGGIITALLIKWAPLSVLFVLPVPMSIAANIVAGQLLAFAGMWVINFVNAERYLNTLHGEAITEDGRRMESAKVARNAKLGAWNSHMSA